MPERIVLILPCCIGDVVLATATLAGLRRAYPHAHITWAVGHWSKPAIEGHPLLDATLDTGALALPVKSWAGFWGFVRQLRDGHFDMAVSLVRSPLMSLAVLASGIRVRAGLDSGRRGFGYTLKAKIDPQQPRHEAQIYLSVLQAMGIDTVDCRANIAVRDDDRHTVRDVLQKHDIQPPYIVVNPAGGNNPGMTMDSKRYPPHLLALLAQQLADYYQAQWVIVAGPKDRTIVDALQAHLSKPVPAFVGEFSFGQMGALAHEALLYIGNDTGMTHLAAASGAKTVMILGPSDPVRYAPFTPNSLALWKPTPVKAGGVAQGAVQGWDWSRDGITVEEAFEQIVAFAPQSV